MKNMKIEVPVTLKLSGFVREGETKEDAKARIAFEAEQRINATGDIRGHVSLKKDDPWRFFPKPIFPKPRKSA